MDFTHYSGDTRISGDILNNEIPAGYAIGNDKEETKIVTVKDFCTVIN